MGKVTERALARLRELGAGNGLEADAFQLISTHEALLTLKAEMVLTPDVARAAQHYPGAFRMPAKKHRIAVQKAADKAQLDARVAALKDKPLANQAWQQAAVKQLQAQPACGWGMDNITITLDGQKTLFYTQEKCSLCNGQGSQRCETCYGSGRVRCELCFGTGEEKCSLCHGTGQNPNQPGQYCLQCQGRCSQPCRQCNGTRQMGCPRCRSRGNLGCDSCKGQRQFTFQEMVTPAVQGSFHLVLGQDLPTPFRRVLSRFGSKRLAKADAKISMGAPVEADKKTAVIPYTALVAYGEARLKINGQTMQAVLLGTKPAILELPPFLDAVLLAKITAYEQAVQEKDTLRQALQVRLLRQAFAILQQGGDAAALRRLYPTGLSLAVAEKALRLMQKLVQQKTVSVRLGASILAVLLSQILVAAYLFGGLRAQLSPPILMLFADILLLGLAATLPLFTARYAAWQQLRQVLGKHALPSQRGGKTPLIAGFISLILAAALMALGGVTPSLKTLLMGLLHG